MVLKPALSRRWFPQSGSLLAIPHLGRFRYGGSPSNHPGENEGVYYMGIGENLPSDGTQIWLSTEIISCQPEPSTADVVWMVMNLAAGVPVWLCIGIFSLYHLYCAAGNSTTIEGWEKDRVATLVRRGKIKEIKYPYVSLLTSRCSSDWSTC